MRIAAVYAAALAAGFAVVMTLICVVRYAP